MIQKKDWLTIAVLTVVTMISWLVFEIYHAASSSTTTTVEEQLAQPLNPKLNETTLERIRKLNSL